jgi:hypothetical protein
VNWINKGDLLNYEGEVFIVLNEPRPNLFGQVKYELMLLSEFWEAYKEHGNGD